MSTTTVEPTPQQIADVAAQLASKHGPIQLADELARRVRMYEQGGWDDQRRATVAAFARTLLELVTEPPPIATIKRAPHVGDVVVSFKSQRLYRVTKLYSGVIAVDHVHDGLPNAFARREVAVVASSVLDELERGVR